MITSIHLSSETKKRLESHLQEGEILEDVIIKLLDLDDKYGKLDPIEFEVNFDDKLIKVFRINDDLFEYFTPARKFSVTLSDWNLPDEFYDEWVSFITNPESVPVLIGLRDNIIECGCFMIRQI